MAQLDKDVAEYCKLVPHAAEKARADAAKLRTKLEAKQRKLVRDYYGAENYGNEE